MLPFVLLMLTLASLMAIAGIQRATLHTALIRSLNLHAQMEDVLGATLQQGRAEVLALAEQADFAAAALAQYARAQRDSWQDFDWSNATDAASTSLVAGAFFVERLHTTEAHCCHFLINARAVKSGEATALFGQSALSFHVASTATYELFSHVDRIIVE